MWKGFRWLRPDIDEKFAGHPIDKAWELFPSPMLLAANCLTAVAGLDAADRRKMEDCDAALMSALKFRSLGSPLTISESSLFIFVLSAPLNITYSISISVGSRLP